MTDCLYTVWNPSSLLAGARIGGEWVGGFEIFDDGAEVDGFGIERFVFGDLCPIQNPKAVAFEHFFAAPALEGDDLAANPFFAGAIEVTQIRAHQRARSRNLSRFRQEIDVKMRDAPRLGGHFSPAVH